MKIACIAAQPRVCGVKFSLREEKTCKVDVLSCNYYNKSSALAFKSNVPNSEAHILTTSDQNFENELRLSKKARELGFNTPLISPNKTYLVHGKNASYPDNPIKKSHIKNVLENILLLDENQIFHGDIEKAHVFYSENSPKVEFDCFKFGCLFDENPGWMSWEFPDNMYPSNLAQFENNCIGDYLHQVEDSNYQDEILKDYLKLASDFHAKRAEYLASQNASEDKIEYEILCSKMYDSLDADVLRFLKQRIKFKYDERLAFTKIDEGRGAGGHPIDESMVIDGVYDYLGVMEATLRYLKRIENVKNLAKTSRQKEKFLEAESKYAKHWFDNYITIAGNNAKDTLDPNNPYNKTHKNVEKIYIDKLRQMFEELRDIENIDDKMCNIDAMADIYGDLLNKE